MNFLEEKTEDGIDIMEESLPFLFERSDDVACLVQHGFTSTTSSVRDYAEYLAENGITCLGPRLPGHGTNVRHMGTKTFGDWVARVEEAFGFLSDNYKTVFLTGLSLGGTLTLYLAERYSDRLAGIIPVCPAIFLKNPAVPLAKYLKYIVKVLPVGAAGDLKDNDAVEIAYDKISVPAINELAKLMKLVKERLPEVECPVKLVHARDDHVVKPASSIYAYEHIRSKDKSLIWLENSYHVATLDYDSDILFREALEFINERS